MTNNNSNTKKARGSFTMDQTIYDRTLAQCEIENRNLSNFLEYVVTLYLDKHETPIQQMANNGADKLPGFN
jgi:hypothetical protein